MMSTENMLSLSTAAIDHDRPKYYLSADDAVGAYLKLRALVEACPALDYEKLGDLVQSQAAPENPHIDKLSEIWFLERVFDRARGIASDVQWHHWTRVRVYGEILRGFRGASKTTVLRNVHRVDGLIEEELAFHRRIVRSQVRGAVV